MLDLTQEKPLPLKEAARLRCIPRRRGGRPLHYSTLLRWIQIGVRGIRLEAVRAGGSFCTTEPALIRFFNKLAGNDVQMNAMSPTATQRRRQVGDAERELARANI